MQLTPIELPNRLPKTNCLESGSCLLIEYYLLIPEPKPVEYESRRFCMDRYKISSGVWSIMDSPSSATSKIIWNSQFEVDADCWSCESFSEICDIDEETLLVIAVRGSFSGIQSLILMTLTLSSFRILTRRALFGPPFTRLGWWSNISSILYFSDVEWSVPSTRSSSNRGLPRSSHRKEADALGRRDRHESLAPSTCWKRMGKNRERFSILSIDTFIVILTTADSYKDRSQPWRFF